MKTAICCVVLLVVVGGCIPSRPLEQGELDRVWTLTDDPTEASHLHQPVFGGRKLPAKWIIRQNPSLVWSTVSIVRAFDRLKSDANEIEFSISPGHADTLADLIGDVRAAMKNLSKLSQPESRSDREYWSRTMAETLVLIEQVARSAGLEDQQGQLAQTGDPMALPAGPLLQMLSLYLNENSGGELLGDMSAADVRQLRVVMTQMILRLGFDLAGRQLPAPLRTSVTELMRQTDRMDALQTALSDLLGTSADAAPPSGREGEMSKIFRVFTTWAPKAFEVVEAFVRQWDRLDRIEVELRRMGDRSVVVVNINVLPGREVRLADIMILQPTLVFRGASRIIVMPKAPSTGEAVILFEPVEGGVVEMRFEGVLYGLAKLFAFPLADGALREIRVSSEPRKQGRQLVNVAMFMAARNDPKDKRRLLVFHDVRDKRIVREAFTVKSVTDREEQVVNYFTSTRRYTYKRLKSLSE